MAGSNEARRGGSRQRPAAPLLWALLTVGLAGCGDEPKTPKSADAPALKFENAGPEVRYVGSEACTECHQEEAAAHAASAHARSFGSLGPEDAERLAGTLDHEPSAVVYRLDAHEGALRVRESLHMPDSGEELLSTRTVTHWIGSGDHRREYVATVDGWSMLAPFMRTSEGGDAWQIAPECDRTLQPGFARPLDPECVYCHTGRVTQIDDTVHRYRFIEEGISCERCHGPGSLHVDHQRKVAASGAATDRAGEAPDRTIVAPADLPREWAVAICAQCHMSTALTVERVGRRRGSWRPSEPWGDAHVTLRLENRPDQVPGAMHVDQLAASRCYQASPAMTCTTCHEAHGHGADAAAARQAARAACAQCHESCDREGAPASTGDDCLRCHMPAAAERVPHEVFHDHRIRLPDASGAEPSAPSGAVKGSPDAEELSFFLGDAASLSDAERARIRGLLLVRHAEWFRAKSGAGSKGDDALRWLEQAKQAGLEDVRVARARALASARDAEKRGEVADALQAVRERPDADAVLTPQELAELLDAWLFHRGPVMGPAGESHLRVFEKLVSLRRTAGDWSRLGMLRAASGEREKVLEAMAKALEIWPSHPGLQHDIAGAFFAQDRKQEAAKHDRIFQKLSRQQSYVAPREPK